jgi:hypothetical protein
MDIIQELLQNVPLPRMATIRQHFTAEAVGDIAGAVAGEMRRPGIGEQVRPGARIAITVGSRGIAEIAAIVRATVAEVRRRGGEPFIVPAMGSHGGATAAGQAEVLAGLGVTEESAGCPIVSSMEVVALGKLENGLTVFIDRQALGADGIIVLNRVKPHTAFRGPSESGLVKMLTIGLGKQIGADSCHAYGFGHMARHIVDMAGIVLAKAPVLFGLAIIENANEKIAKIAGVPAAAIIETDKLLLKEAKANMPRLPFDKLDVLIVDRIGKEFSGDGMDPNITGRYSTPFASGGPEVNKIVVLDLTAETHGNANGIGVADFTTRRLLDKINYQYTYANAFTSTITVPARLPLIMESDYDAVRAAIKTCNARDLSQPRIVRISDTLHINEMSISEALLVEAEATPNISVLAESRPMAFGPAGELLGG